MNTKIVIIGAGQAGLQVASSLRDLGFSGKITLVGDEPYPPYQRPPLSKSFLSGDSSEESLFMQEPDYFNNLGIEFVAGDSAIAINRDICSVDLSSGASLAYDHLILATGTRNRRLPCLEADVPGIISLRTLIDAKSLSRGLQNARSIVIIGAGFLGLEAATVAAQAGRHVQVIEAGSRALGRVVSSPTSSLFQNRHEAQGVSFDFNQTVVAIHQNGSSRVVELRGGRRIEADLVLVSIGVVPNTALASAAGLEVQNGIVVDETLLTEDQNISAIGDCAAFPFAADAGRLVRLESVQNAVDQARCVANRITGAAEAYDQVPLFWSNQAGLRLQIAGLTAGDDRAVTRGDVESAAFSVFCYRGERLAGVESVNRSADHMLARKLLRSQLNPRPDQAADMSFDLKAWANAPVGAA